MSSLFFLTALIAALLVVMSLICAFCSYDGATNQRELGQHVRYCGARYCGARYCGAATSPGGGDGGAPRAIVGGGGGGIRGGGGGDGDGGASYDAVAAMDTSQVLRGSAEASFVEDFDWEGGGDGGEADDESTGTGTGADDDSAGTGMNCSASMGSFESAAAPAPPPAAPMAPAAAPVGGAGSQRARDLATSALLSPLGVCASIELYGVLSDQGVSGNGYEKIVAHLYKNSSGIVDALETGTLFRTADAVRGKIHKGLELQGVPSATKESLRLQGAGRDADTLASLSRSDVLAQLREHLLQPDLPSPPLSGPPFVHLFSNNKSTDNMANSRAGLEFNASLQRSWKEMGAAGWVDPLHRIVERQYPGKTHHLHVVQSCVFIDAFAASEGMKAEFYQGRIKLGTVHPELAFLTSTYLLSGIAKKVALPERVSDETRMRHNDLHAEMWAKLGWEPFFTDQFVALSHDEVKHLGLPGSAGDIHIFKLALLGLLLDNGEVRSVVGTQGCLLCNELTKNKVPVAPSPAAPCPLCQKSHAPHALDGRRFDLALQQYEIIYTFKPDGVVASAGGPGAPRLSPAEQAHHAALVSRAQQTLSNLGFNSDISAPALSRHWVPTQHIKYFAWGGAIAALCGQPLLCFMFECVRRFWVARPFKSNSIPPPSTFFPPQPSAVCCTRWSWAGKNSFFLLL